MKQIRLQLCLPLFLLFVITCEKSYCSDYKTLTPSQDKQNAWLIKQIKKTNEYYHGFIIKTSDRYGLEPSLIKAVIMAESGFRTQTVSRTGAQGLMQLMPGTARALSVENAFNPENNITGGVRHLKYLLKKCSGDLDLALAAYNAGMSNVNKYDGIPPYRETLNYIKRVRQYKEYYELVMNNRI